MSACDDGFDGERVVVFVEDGDFFVDVEFEVCVAGADVAHGDEGGVVFLAEGDEGGVGHGGAAKKIGGDALIVFLVDEHADERAGFEGFDHLATALAGFGVGGDFAVQCSCAHEEFIGPGIIRSAIGGVYDAVFLHEAGDGVDFPVAEMGAEDDGGFIGGDAVVVEDFCVIAGDFFQVRVFGDDAP